MGILFFFFFLAIQMKEPLITKSKIESLKSKVSFEVTSYEDNIFKDFNDEDITLEDNPFGINVNDDDTPTKTIQTNAFESFSLLSSPSADCIHPIRDHSTCIGGSFAFAVAGMISDRCCMKSSDAGWLSMMELIACDKSNYGCAGGWPAWAVNYTAIEGLVTEDCYPFTPRPESCPNRCKGAKEWKTDHKCKCPKIVLVPTLNDIKNALPKGPVVVTFEAYDDFFFYKSGVYCHKEGRFKRLISGRVIGFNETNTPPYLLMATSFGEKFGEKGYIKFCTTCCGVVEKYDKGNVACEY